MSMSMRQQVAQGLADTCIFGNLNDSYGVSVTKNTEVGKSYWTVLFAKAAILDGVIRVYSPNFIQVKWQGKLGKGSEVLKSEQAAKSFLTSKFITPYI